MFRIAVIPPPGALVTVLQVLRRHVDLPLGELRQRLTSGQPVFEGELVDVVEVRRCRALVLAAEKLGAELRVFEEVPGFGVCEESVELLRNAMRRNIQIARTLRDEDR